MEFDLDTELTDPRFDEWAQQLTQSLVSVTESSRNDSNETGIFARQLEYIYTRTYDIQYPEYKARTFIPLDTSVPNWAEEYTYRQFDSVGVASMITNYADNVPDVTLLGKEFTAKCYSMSVGYGYSVQDIRRAQATGLPLEQRYVNMAKRAIEARIDTCAAFGDSYLGFTGFLNNANVPLITPITGTWSTATADQICADLDKLVNSIFLTTQTVISPDTLLFDPATYLLLNSKPRNTLTDVTVLKWYLANSPFIKNVDHWYLLTNANAALNGPRVVCYKRNPDVLGLVIPQEFEQFPPQVKNMKFFIQCHARIGGVKTPYPLGIAYMDGI